MNMNKQNYTLTIMDRVLNKRHEFVRNTGDDPKYVYLGECEMDELSRSIETQTTIRSQNLQTFYPSSIMGLKVVRVCEISHFNVA